MQYEHVGKVMFGYALYQLAVTPINPSKELELDFRLLTSYHSLPDDLRVGSSDPHRLHRLPQVLQHRYSACHGQGAHLHHCSGKCDSEQVSAFDERGAGEQEQRDFDEETMLTLDALHSYATVVRKSLLLESFGGESIRCTASLRSRLVSEQICK